MGAILRHRDKFVCDSSSQPSPFGQLNTKRVPSNEFVSAVGGGVDRAVTATALLTV